MAPNPPAQGDFPFCFSDDPCAEDTPAVRQWRNRSRYLTRRGIRDLTAALYHYNRGVLGNLLIIAPPMILLALFVSFFYTWMRHHPYWVSLGLLISLLILHFLDYVCYQERGPAKSPGWQALRNGIRASLIHTLPFALLIETVPFCIDTLRHFRPSGTLGIPQSIGFLATAASASGLFRFVSPTTRTGRFGISLAVSLISWAMLAAVLLGLVDYLYFGIPPYGLFLLVPFAALAVTIASLSRIFLTLATRAVVWAKHFFPPPLAASDVPVRQPTSGLFASAFTRWKAQTTCLRRWLINIMPYFTTLCCFVLGAWAALTSMDIFIESYSTQCRFSAQRVAEITRPLANLEPALRPLTEWSAAPSRNHSQQSGNADPDRRLALNSSALPLPTHETLNHASANTTQSVLSTIAEKRKSLDAGTNDTWAQEYTRTSMAPLLRWLETRVTARLSRDSSNHSLYQAEQKSDTISQWGLLYPLRPIHHGNAVAFLHSVAALDALPWQGKQDLKIQITRYSVNKLSDKFNATDVVGPYSAQPLTRRQFALNCILVQALVDHILRPASDGSPRVNLDSFLTCIDATGSLGSEQVDTIIHEALSTDFLNAAMRTVAIPQDDDLFYSRLFNSPSKRLSLLDELRYPIETFNNDVALRRQVIVEALLACLARVHDFEYPEGIATVSRVLAALPPGLCSDDLFHLGPERLDDWKSLLRMTPADLAMVAAGLVRCPANATRTQDRETPFVAEQYISDAFRHGVCLATNQPSDIVTHSDSPRYYNTDAWIKPFRRRQAQLILCHRAMFPLERDWKTKRESDVILGQLSRPLIPSSHCFRRNLHENDMIMEAILLGNRRGPGKYLLDETILRVLFTRLVDEAKYRTACSSAIRMIGVGRYGNVEQLGAMVEEVNQSTWWDKAVLLTSVAAASLFFCIAFVDPNVTAIHRFYRNALCSSFFPTRTLPATDGEEPGADVRLSALAARERGSLAPYPLINASMNVSSNARESLRERRAVHFLFSPLYVGEASEESLRATYWNTPDFEARHPSFTAGSAMTVSGAAAAPLMGRYSNWMIRLAMVLTNLRLGYWIRHPATTVRLESLVTLEQVLADELKSIKERRQCTFKADNDTRMHLVGLAFSGGGIRSAAFNFGIAQALFRHKIWKYVDYLSTVSGGGYVGTAISVFMREYPTEQNNRNLTQQTPSPQRDCSGDKQSHNRIATTVATPEPWTMQVPACFCLLFEIAGVAGRGWAYVSDGGHFENLGVYALMQRKCRLIIAGDGEADPNAELEGLSRLLMLGEIDLGARVEFPRGDLDRIKRTRPFGGRHFAVGRIEYADRSEGWLVYLRSSLTGDEDQVISGYRAKHRSFPHESTADQIFTEDQFEAYRRLGDHIAERACKEVFADEPPVNFTELIDVVRRFFEKRIAAIAAEAKNESSTAR